MTTITTGQVIKKRIEHHFVLKILVDSGNFRSTDVCKTDCTFNPSMLVRP